MYKSVLGAGIFAHGLALLPRFACLLVFSRSFAQHECCTKLRENSSQNLGLRPRRNHNASGKPHHPPEPQGAAYTYQESFAGLAPEPLDPNKRFLDSGFAYARNDNNDVALLRLRVQRQTPLPANTAIFAGTGPSRDTRTRTCRAKVSFAPLKRGGQTAILAQNVVCPPNQIGANYTYAPYATGYPAGGH